MNPATKATARGPWLSRIFLNLLAAAETASPLDTTVHGSWCLDLF